MANGLLGKATITRREDAELVYTVPSSRTATFNISVLNPNNNQAQVIDVFLSGDTYQTADFENFIETAAESLLLDYSISSIIGSGQYLLFVPRLSCGQLTDPVKVVYAEIAGAMGVYSSQKGTITYGECALDGDIVPFFEGTDVMIRRLEEGGGIYTVSNFVTGGSAASSFSNYGFSDGSPVKWAGDHSVTGDTAAFGLFFNQGNSNQVNTTTSVYDETQDYGTLYNFTFGSVHCVRPSHTGRYILGTNAGQLYWSNVIAPASASDWANSSIAFTQTATWKPSSLNGGFPPTIGNPILIDATSTDTHVYLLCDGGGSAGIYVLWNDFASAADSNAPADNWALGTAPIEISSSVDIMDFYHDGTNLVIATRDYVDYMSADHSETWSNAARKGSGYYDIRVVSTSNGNKYAVNDAYEPEITLYRGYTYTFNQGHQSNNSHPLFLSETKDGTRAGGTRYETGIEYYIGAPTGALPHEHYAVDAATYETNVATIVGEARYFKFTVPSDAPDTLYTYCLSHNGMGYRVKIVDAPSATDNKNHITHIQLFDVDTDDFSVGDEVERREIYVDGVQKTRRKRFYPLMYTGISDAHLLDRVTLTGYDVMERTGVVASEGEQLIVKATGENIVVRVHGIEE
mgnify:CR=1 FL=1